MRVDDDLLERAVLNLYARSIYGHYDVSPLPGRHLSLSGLRQEWREVHLRADDLDRALERLQMRGEISCELLDGEPHYALTERGIAAGLDRHWRSPRDFWHHLKAMVKLTTSQVRRGTVSDVTPRRRRSDQRPTVPGSEVDSERKPA